MDGCMDKHKLIGPSMLSVQTHFGFLISFKTVTVSIYSLLYVFIDSLILDFQYPPKVLMDSVIHFSVKYDMNTKVW